MLVSSSWVICVYPAYNGKHTCIMPNTYVLLKALKYTAQDESRVANIARGEAECYICHETLIKSCIFYTKQQCFKCFIVFYTYQSVNKTQIFGHFNTFIE